MGSPLYSEDPDNAEVLSTLETHTVPEMFAEILPKYSVAPGTSAEIIAKTLATSNPNGPDDVRRVWRAATSADIRVQAPLVTCPVTVVTGEFDFTVTPEHAKLLAEALHARFVEIPGIGHLPMLEDPATTVRLINEHLARVEGEE